MKTNKVELSNIPTLTKKYINMSDETLESELGEYVSGLTTTIYFPTLENAD